MKKKDIIHKIELLKKIEPRESWADLARSTLLSQITAQEKPVIISKHVFLERTFASLQDGLVASERLFVRAFFSRRVGSFVALSLLIVGTAAASVFSQNSLPGDPLYAVKKTKENVRVAVAQPQDRPSLELEFADQRILELDRVATQGTSKEEKGEKTKELVQNVSERVERVSDELSQIKKSSKTERIASVTSLITKKTSKYESSLQHLGANKNVSEPVKQEALAALQKVQEARTNALEVLVDRKSDIGEKQVSDQFAEQVKDVEKTLANLHARVTIAVAEKSESKEALEKSNKASQILRDAKEALEHNDFRLALEQLNQSRELAQEASRVLQDSLRKGDADMKVQGENESGLK